MDMKLVDDYIAALKVFEGYTNYLYNDSNGYITIGTGLNYAGRFNQLYHDIRFYFKSPPYKPATLAKRNDVKTDYDHVTGSKRRAKAQQDFNYFMSLCLLRGSDEDLEKVFKKMLNSKIADTRRIFNNMYTGPYAYKYTNFDQLPASAQWALVDIQYNTKTGIAGFGNLCFHIKRGDWNLAAGQSRRHITGNTGKDNVYKRNLTTAMWLIMAGREENGVQLNSWNCNNRNPITSVAPSGTITFAPNTNFQTLYKACSI